MLVSSPTSSGEEEDKRSVEGMVMRILRISQKHQDEDPTFASFGDAPMKASLCVNLNGFLSRITCGFQSFSRFVGACHGNLRKVML